MSGWLVTSGVQVECDHLNSTIQWGVDVGASIGVWHIVVEEGGWDITVQWDTVRLNGQAVQNRIAAHVLGLTIDSGHIVEQLLSGRSCGISEVCGVVELIKSSLAKNIVNLVNTWVVRNCQSSKVNSGECNHNCGNLGTLQTSGLLREEESVGQAASLIGILASAGIHVPALKQLGAVLINVLHWAQAKVEGLNGPLQLLMQDTISVLAGTSGLLTMDANQGESNTLNENIVTIIPISIRDLSLISSIITLLKGNHPHGWV